MNDQVRADFIVLHVALCLWSTDLWGSITIFESLGYDSLLFSGSVAKAYCCFEVHFSHRRLSSTLYIANRGFSVIESSSFLRARRI